MDVLTAFRLQRVADTPHRRPSLRHLLHRFTALAVALVLGLAPQALYAQTSKTDSSNPPNIVLIMADDLGYGDLSCYGGWIKTPHLDGLAKTGMRLLDFHSSGAVCSPTGAGLLTGMYQQRVGVPGVVTAKNHRDRGLSTEYTTFARLLKDAGYKTAVFGKWHVGYHRRFNPLRHGFDRFRGYVSGNVDYFSHIDQTGVYDWWAGEELVEEDGYSTHLITRHSVDFINEHRERPFCLYVAHEAPHYPYQGPDDEAERTVNGSFPTAGGRSDKKTAYREMVVEMDKGVGEIIEALTRHNLRESTFVFFLSDNGATRLGSNGPLNGHKGTVWEGGHRVPALANWPGKIEGGVTSDLTGICLDLLPTMADLAGVEVPKTLSLDGRSLLPVLTGESKSAQPERTLFWRHAKQKAVRKGNWKYLEIAPKRSNKTIRGLFDLNSDVGEKNDLSKKHPDVLADLQGRLAEWERYVGPDEFGR